MCDRQAVVACAKLARRGEAVRRRALVEKEGGGVRARSLDGGRRGGHGGGRRGRRGVKVACGVGLAAAVCSGGTHTPARRGGGGSGPWIRVCHTAHRELRRTPGSAGGGHAAPRGSEEQRVCVCVWHCEGAFSPKRTRERARGGAPLLPATQHGAGCGMQVCGREAAGGRWSSGGSSARCGRRLRCPPHLRRAMWCLRLLAVVQFGISVTVQSVFR